MRKAANDVDRLRKFIAKKNPIAAQKAARRIREGVINVLRENPEAGRTMEHDNELRDYRELILPFGKGSYIVRCRYG